MIQNIFPLFVRNRIMKKEYLWALRDRSFLADAIRYQDFSDGIVTGCALAVEGSCLTVGRGLVKKDGFLYELTEPQSITYPCTEELVLLKMRLTKKNVQQEYLLYEAAFVLDPSPTLAENELELCRYKLKRGFDLRIKYKDFYDVETEFDTVNQASASWAGLRAPSLAPYITAYFARQALRCPDLQPADLAFAYRCLDRTVAMPREVLLHYTATHLGRDPSSPRSNVQLFHDLEVILEALRHGQNMRTSGRGLGRRQMIMD